MSESPTESDRSSVSILAIVVSVVALLLATVGVIVVATNDSEGSSSGEATSIDVKLTEFAITPKALTASAGTVKIVVTNAGTMPHDLQVTQLDKKTAIINPGQTETLDLGSVKAGTYDVICTVPGHADSGMKATLTVGAATAAAGGSAAGAASIGNPDDAKIDFAAAAPEGFTARDPNAPPPLPGTVHELTLEASESNLDVAPGVSQQMWSFNLAGQPPTVPGPILRGKVGDTFRITLVNKGSIDHSIDFHASKVAWNDEMRSIHGGESLVYEFTANYAGAWMYHCGTAPALHHIGNGMYGAIIIDPPVLAPVDHEFVIVQSEIYTGPQGQPGDLAKMTANAWDAVVFNGYVSQYKFQPIRVEPDQRVRVWVIDDGPSENSAFHIVGTVFDTVWREGTYLLQPDQRRGGSQVLDLQPAQGGFVEFSLAERGLYPMVTHKFSNVGKGALGLFQAGDAPPPAAGAPAPAH
jgi:nitrite reductase (NO-forming)